jgi:hypothetical protein
MCRSIRVLANFEPPATDDEIHAAALQFVRKVAGTAKPSKANEARFAEAVTAITAITHDLVHQLESPTPKRNRDVEAAKAKAKAAARYG